MDLFNNSIMNETYNDTNNDSSDTSCTDMTAEGVDYARGLTLLGIAVIAIFGNFMTIFIMLKFKTIKIPDLLVIALAVNDLITTLVPIIMSIVAYLRGEDYKMDSIACNFFGVIAAYTRFTAALLVTVISVERYLAVKEPMFYRKHCTPSLFKKLLVLVFVFNALLAFPPAVDPNTPINAYHGFCLFSFTRIYAIFIVAYANIQFIIVLFCFICIVKELYNLHQRRKHMTAQNMYNKYSTATITRDNVSFSKPGLASKVSDLGQRLKKTAPVIGERLQLSIEAQFARMLLAVTILFYINWLPTVILIMYEMAKEGIIMDPDQRECTKNIEDILFWTIRATVISTALNPLLYGFLAQQYRGAYVYLLKLLFSKCCPCVSPPTKNVFLQDRKQQVQWNKDPPVQQLHYKNIGTYRPHSLNGYSYGGSSVPSNVTNQTHLSMPDLDTVPEDSIISVENGVHLPSVGDVHSSVGITQDMDPYNGRLRSASMNGLLDNIDTRHITNPLHDSDDSTIQMSPTSREHLISDSDSMEHPLHDSDEPSRQKNGFVRHLEYNSSEDHRDCATSNTKTFSVTFESSKDASFLTLASVI